MLYKNNAFQVLGLEHCTILTENQLKSELKIFFDWDTRIF